MQESEGKNSLYLVLKEKWYDMIESGEKTEEYRDITPYWYNRLLWDDDYDKKPWDKDVELFVKNHKALDNALFAGCYRPKFNTVTFQRAYHRNPSRMTFRINSILIGKGNVKWGAESYKEYFIIKLGERISSLGTNSRNMPSDESCFYHQDGNCNKGLPGTPCEVKGCVAHTTTPSTERLCWNEMAEGEKSDFLFNLTHIVTNK